MRIINYGKSYDIFDDDNVLIMDEFPAQTYRISFHPQKGFSLYKAQDISTTEDTKIYGKSKEKAQKVMKRYNSFEKSMGVILSGDKGIGKSLFVQQLAKEAISQNIPVILVTDAIPGITEFLDNIQQECLIIFDEFEKVFIDNEELENREPQSKLLGLFDGTSKQKRLYALTVNHLYKVNEFMINRPGRFHFHIRFGYPQDVEITDYLKDNLKEEYFDKIQDVVNLSWKLPLNYDCLQAIATELNEGETLASALEDLNIINSEELEKELTIKFKDGSSDVLNKRVDMFSDDEYINYFSQSKKDFIQIYFSTKTGTFKDKDMVITEFKKVTSDDNSLMVDVESISIKSKEKNLYKLF